MRASFVLTAKWWESERVESGKEEAHKTNTAEGCTRYLFTCSICPHLERGSHTRKKGRQDIGLV